MDAQARHTESLTYRGRLGIAQLAARVAVARIAVASGPPRNPPHSLRPGRPGGAGRPRRRAGAANRHRRRHALRRRHLLVAGRAGGRQRHEATGGARRGRLPELLRGEATAVAGHGYKRGPLIPTAGPPSAGTVRLFSYRHHDPLAMPLQGAKFTAPSIKTTSCHDKIARDLQL